MQTKLLAMAAQVLATAQDEAQASEAASKSKLEVVQAELAARKATSVAAKEELTTAQAAAAAQKELLSECKRKVTREEQEHKRLESVEKAEAKIMNGLRKDKCEVASLLMGIEQKDTTDDINDFLASEGADRVLIASMPSMLSKEPAERSGFDLVALAALREFLESKVAAAEAQIAEQTERQTDAHAEAVGAFAVMDLAKDETKEAAANLKEAEATSEDCREKLREANTTMQEEESIVAQSLVETTMASEQVRRCCDGVSLLKKLAMGPEPEPEAPAADAEMGVTEAAALDVEMAVEVAA